MGRRHKGRGPTDGQTDGRTLLPALVSGLPAQHSHLWPSSRLKVHLVMAPGWALMLRGVCGVSGALFQALKELILLQVVVAGRGASAGAYSPSRCFDLCFPSRGEPVRAGLLPAGQGSGSHSRSLLPTPQAAEGPGGPSEQAASRQGSWETVLETLKWGPVLVRRVTSSSLLCP